MLLGVGGGTTGTVASEAERAVLAMLVVTAATIVGVGTEDRGGNVVGSLLKDSMPGTEAGFGATPLQ